MKKALTDAGAQAKLVAPRLGVLKSAKGAEVKVDFSLLTASSVLFDAVYVPGGEKSVKALQKHVEAAGVCAGGLQTLQDHRCQWRRG